jgi:transcription initiation factor TFIIF subunit alpha
MSASPAGQPNDQNPNPIPPRLVRRRPRNTDPLVPRRKPIHKPATPLSTAPSSGSNNTLAPGKVQRPLPPAKQQLNSFEALRKQNGGWSQPPPAGAFTDFPVYTTKRALKDGIRFHVMRLASSKLAEEDKPIDPTDQQQFTRPVTLGRRDARQPPPGRVVKEFRPEPPPVDEKEAERLAQLKAEREAQKAINEAQIAPSVKEQVQKKQPQNKKQDDVQFYRQPRTEEQKKEADLRYEEALPWHLEDADGKNVWTGTYISALSEANVAFIIDGNKFRMVPLEKWYKFTAKPPFSAYTVEEAEALMSKKTEPSRWLMRDKVKSAERKEWDATRHLFHGPARIKTESNTFRAAGRGEKMDHDEIDMSGDEFQDDDENPGLEIDNDEETKDSMQRIRRNQLGANLFGDADEQAVDKNEAEERLLEEVERKFGKKMKKTLIKREKELLYESDSSNYDPFASSSVSLKMQHCL